MIQLQEALAMWQHHVASVLCQQANVTMSHFEPKEYICYNLLENINIVHRVELAFEFLREDRVPSREGLLEDPANQEMGWGKTTASAL